ncbi:DUF2231 domain-containing protein [Gloeobacter kilaueensis]|uniref:DUF2231 domain-containing protein n=1 Tax=Gloeobacter kilaueensis (strain ATCC BAA-2537 / CCAP 1431/1 / ULC 316 / JS1) TaxID=1183438 RepID=U5QMZ8_GLOK1|nr:DUF2231 domain-containing protein [Gloeobacter kilaueensis]AGY59050.1 hypothetical protein GKIL_2804 [Gloeobacter kilaueensis JS1]
MGRHPNIPPIVESRESDYRDSGVESSVAIAGHPLHPAIVTFPIAFLVAAFGSDLGYYLTRDPFWARASLWLLGAGLITGLIAALTGMSDFLRVKRVQARTAGWLHMSLNVVALGLTVVNFWARLGDSAAAVLPFGIVASAIVAALLGASGWFGGELSFRHKIGVIGDHDERVP